MVGLAIFLLFFKRRLTCCLLVLLMLGGCGAGKSLEQGFRSSYSLGNRKPVSLAIHGFNYTDLVISAFSVQGQGGGNIYVSSPTSGGGGATCCVRWWPGSKLPAPIEVEWMRFLNDKQRWCKKTVMLTGPVPNEPKAIAVHFMPDGDVQVELTAGRQVPKLSLPRFDPGMRNETDNVIHDEEVARCADSR